MLKIKIITVLSILFIVGLVMSNSRSVLTSANGDVFQEIAKYKTWSRINKEPIKVGLNMTLSSNSFTVDALSGGG